MEFDIYCLIGIALDVVIITDTSWFMSHFSFRLWTPHDDQIYSRAPTICYVLINNAFFARRSSTRPSAFTTAALIWTVCPPPALAWTCSSFRSSATSTWWGTSCCTQSSPLLVLSWAEEDKGSSVPVFTDLTPQKWVCEKNIRDGDKETGERWKMMHWPCFSVCVCVRVRQAEARAEGSYLQTQNEMVPEWSRAEGFLNLLLLSNLKWLITSQNTSEEGWYSAVLQKILYPLRKTSNEQ